MQPEIAVQQVRPGGSQAFLGYRWQLAFLVGFMALGLVALVDVRRGFLFDEYSWVTPWAVFCPWHLLMAIASLGGAAALFHRLRQRERSLSEGGLDGTVKLLAFALFGILVVDLLAYRGIAAERVASAGGLGAGWLDAFGVTGWARPAGVNATATSVKNGAESGRFARSRLTGSASANGVSAQPPSANASRPPRVRSPPPRTLTKSASIWS